MGNQGSEQSLVSRLKSVGEDKQTTKQTSTEHQTFPLGYNCLNQSLQLLTRISVKRC